MDWVLGVLLFWSYASLVWFYVGCSTNISTFFDRGRVVSWGDSTPSLYKARSYIGGALGGGYRCWWCGCDLVFWHLVVGGVKGWG